MKPLAVQTAVFDVLSGDATLVAMLSDAYDVGIVPIFDAIPQPGDSEDDADFPYISFGTDFTSPMDTKGDNGGNALLQINVWTRSPGFAETKTIAQRVYDLLQKQSLTISGATHIATRVESVDYARDPDGLTRRALMQFRVTYFNI